MLERAAASASRLCVSGNRESARICHQIIGDVLNEHGYSPKIVVQGPQSGYNDGVVLRLDGN
jgi:hypothetical protein